MSCHLIDTVHKLGFLKLDCPLAVFEQIVSITMCPLVCLGNSTMSLIEVSLINHTGCIVTVVFSKKGSFHTENHWIKWQSLPVTLFRFSSTVTVTDRACNGLFLAQNLSGHLAISRLTAGVFWLDECTSLHLSSYRTSSGEGERERERERASRVASIFAMFDM